MIVRTLSVAVSTAVLAFGLAQTSDGALYDCVDQLTMPPLAPGDEVWRWLPLQNATDEPVSLVSVEALRLPRQVEWTGAVVYDGADTDGMWSGFYTGESDEVHELQQAPVEPVTSWTLAPAGDDSDARYLMAKFRVADGAGPGIYVVGDFLVTYTADGRRNEQQLRCDLVVQVAPPG